MSRIQRIFAWGAFSLVAMLLTGWLFADYLTPPSVGAPGHALAIPDAGEPCKQTRLDKEVAPLVARHGGKTGALLIPDGLDAFSARALATRQAGRSLDLQYYIWHDDLTGRLLAHEVWEAAERGVQVRILLDDMANSGDDAGLLALAAHRNIEIRLYNPIRNRGGIFRVLELVQRIYSVNHRMHNKQWIADGRVAILGGRNIGEEYFDASTETNFRDLDVLVFGPKVAQASKIFDDYWNSKAVVPVSALVDPSPDAMQHLLVKSEQEARRSDAKRYYARMDASSTVRSYFSKGLTPFWTNSIEVVSDPPLKWKEDEDRSGWLLTRLIDELKKTTHKALLISPYFVPGDDTANGLVLLASNHKAFVGVITNSLAANDVPAVHSGYADYRDRLLQGGVRLYEMRANVPVKGSKHRQSGGKQGAGSGGRMLGSSGASLHTKAFLIDDRRGFIGSFNLDPRSAYLNTEMGVLFDDPAISAALRNEYLHLASPRVSYWVSHDANGDLRWLDRTAKPPVLINHEPETTKTQRVIAEILRWLPIESQL